MPDTYVIDYRGIQDIKDNISLYFSMLIDHSVICFRGGELSVPDQVEIATIFGDHSGWFPNSKDLEDSKSKYRFQSNHFYRENHERTITPKVTKNDFLITWHLEHNWRKTPTVAGIWNMQTFTCGEENGKTLFVDTGVIFKMLQKEDQDFLKKCKSYMYTETDVKTIDCVKKHWYTGDEILNMDLYVDHSRDYLVECDGKAPSEDKINRFRKIQNFVMDQVLNNRSIRIVHKWNQGDLLIPDLHKLAHTVTGGFSPEERFFEEMWATSQKYDDYDIMEL